MKLKLSKKFGTAIIIIFLGIFISIIAFGSDSSTEKRGTRHHGPPPEAYAACEGKNVGDAAEFVSPRGDKVTGICVMEGDRLVLRPDNPPPRRDSEGRGNDKNRD